MPASQPTLLGFLKAFRDRWLISMTGSVFAVVFIGLGVYQKQEILKVTFWVLAIGSAFVAAYGVWSSERKARCTSEDRIRELQELPHAAQNLIPTNETHPQGYGFALSITNIGRVNFVVDEVEILASDLRPELYRFNETVPVGGSAFIPLPDIKHAAETSLGQIRFDVQIRARIRWFDCDGWLAPSGYSVLLGVLLGSVNRVERGYRDDRTYACPRCHARPGVFMRVEGIKCEEELQRRKEIYLQELAVSCPEHYSQFGGRLFHDSEISYPGLG